MIIAFHLRMEGTEPGLLSAPNSLFLPTPWIYFAMPKICAIVPAAGRGIRMGKDRPKQFLELAGRSILIHTLEALVKAGFISRILTVAPVDFLTSVEALIDSHFHCSGEGASSSSAGSWLSGPSYGSITPVNSGGYSNLRETDAVGITVVAGGVERQDSVYNALKRLPPDCDWVLVHDGVRPFVSRELLKDTLAAARATGASIAALPATDTVKRAVDGHVAETLDRKEIWLVQTPQVFRTDIILRAYREAYEQGWQCTDDASFVERLGIRVAVVPGERTNIKVTTPEDLAWASWFQDYRAEFS
jgi:2-C-methyl-D-erythritol 4-phosphate cytidylyltransferase